jgi:hypothetical protein
MWNEKIHFRNDSIKTRPKAAAMRMKREMDINEISFLLLKLPEKSISLSRAIDIELDIQSIVRNIHIVMLHCLGQVLCFISYREKTFPL